MSLTFSGLKKASNDYRLWAFHGAPLQFRKRGSDDKWLPKPLTREHIRHWNEDRFEYRVDPSWNGEPKIGDFNVKQQKIIVVKPKPPQWRDVVSYLDNQMLHPNLYIPTFYNGVELPLPEGVRYAWDESGYLPNPNT